MIKKCKIKLKPCDAPNAEVNLTEEQFIALITETNMIGESDSWWLDIVFSHRACYDCAMFKLYTNMKVSLGVAHTTNVVRIREVEQSSPLKKTLILKDAMYTSEIIKNLVISFLLKKARFSLSIGVDLYTITKNDIFVNEIKNQFSKKIRGFVVINELSMILFNEFFKQLVVNGF